MKGFLTLAALLLCFTLLHAQPIRIGVPTLSTAKSFETEGFASLPRQVMFDQTNSVITAGTLETKTDFDPSPTTTAFLQPAAGEGKNSFVSKLNEDGTYAWAYQFGGAYDETVIGMDIDSDNNLYVMGTFYGTVDFDPDPVDTDVRVSTELFGLYLVSFTPAGDFRWVHTWTGGMFKDTGGIRIDDLDNIVMTGTYKGLVDFDPGTGTQDYSSVAGEWDLFVLKLKATTYQFDWVASIGVMAAETGRSIDVDYQGSIYVAGEFTNTVDFDPGPAEYYLDGTGGASYNGFVLKLAQDGTFTWAKEISGTNGSLYINKLLVVWPQEVFLIGRFGGTFDFDTGTGTNLLTSQSGADDGYFMHLLPTGETDWIFTNKDAIAYDMEFDGDNGIVYIGAFGGTADFDPGAAVTTATSNGNSDIFVAKYTNQGYYKWVFTAGGLDIDIGYSVDRNEFDDGTMVLAGKFVNTIDLMPGYCGTQNLSAGAFGGMFLASYIPTEAPSGCLTITQQPVGAAICVGTTVILKTEAIGAPVLNYHWYVSNNDGGYDPLEDGGGRSGTHTNELTITTAGGINEGEYICAISAQGSVVVTNGAIIDIGPDAPKGSDLVLCGQGSATIVVDKGSTLHDGKYRWYTVPTGGTPIAGAVNHSYTTPVLTATTSYFIAVDNGTCEGQRKEIKVNITACEPPPGLVWTKKIGGAFTDGISKSIVDPDGFLVIVGSFQSTVDFDPGPGVTSLTAQGGDGFLMKMTPNGDLVWVKQFTGPGNAFPLEVSLDGVGNIYVAGEITGITDFNPDPDALQVNNLGSLPANRYDVFIGKYDAGGNHIWAKKFGGANHDALGGMKVDPSGNVYAAGHFIGSMVTETTVTSAGFSDAYILKMSTTGAFLWTKKIGAGYSDLGDTAQTLILDGSGNLIVTGSVERGVVDFDPDAVGTYPITVSAEGNDAYILKLDLDGKFKMAVTFPKTNSAGRGNGLAVNVDADGNIVALGNQLGNVDFDPSSNVFELQAFDSYVSTYIVKLTPAGSLIWAKQLRSKFLGGIYGASIVTDNTRSVYISGIYSSNADFDPGPLEYVMDAQGLGLNSYMTKLNSSGEFNWAISFKRSQNVTSSVSGGETLIHGNGDIYTMGSFQGSVDFDPNSCTAEVNTNGQSDMYLQRLSFNVANICMTTEPTDKQSCGGNVTFTALAEGTGGITYQWQKLNTTTALYENITNDANYSGATTGTLTIATNGTFGAGSYRTIASATGATSVTSATAVLTFGGTPPSPPGTNGASSCTASILTLTATGSTDGNYRWYTSATAPTPISGETSSSYTTPQLFASTTFYASISDGACESTRTAVVGTIGAATPPSTTGGATCNASASVTLTASGASDGDYRWYTTASGGTPIAGEVNSTFTTPVISTTTTWYVSIIQGSCESTRTAVVATVNAGSTPPTVSGQSRCGTGTVLLSASGGTDGQFRWYTTSTGGTALTGETNSTFTTPSLSATTSYFVSINYGSCESTRVEIVATITSPGTPPTANGTTVCTNTTATLTATGSGTILWYAQATGGTSLQTGATFVTPVLSATTTYYVSSSNGTCETTRTAVIATVSNCANNQPPVIGAAASSTQAGGSTSINLTPLLSDPDNNLDLSTLKVKVQPKSGAQATIDQNGQITIDYSGVTFTGTDEVTIEICDIAGSCTTRVITIVVSGELFAFNALSPNGDGKNEVLFISSIELMEDTKSNTVRIYNRWGDLVFEVNDYNNTTNVFSGSSNSGKELPSGTYFYTISFDSGKESVNGYLSLKR